MQTNKQLQKLAVEQKLRVCLTTVQHNLEKHGRHRHQRASLLQRRLLQRYQDHDRGKPEEIAEFEAVLLVLRQDYTADAEEPDDCEDREWADVWWSRIQQALQHEGSTSTGFAHAPSTAIDLDTPETADGAPKDNESAHNLELYETAKEEEERELLAMVEEFERQQEARKHRAVEQQQFEEEMRPQTKQRRLQVDVSVASGGSTSTARFHTNVPNSSSTATIAFQLKVVDNESHAAQETNTSHLMQRREQSSAAPDAHDDCLSRLRTLLSGIHPDLRGRVVARLRRLMLCEKNALLQGLQIVDFLRSEHLGNDTQHRHEEVVDRMAQFIMTNLDITDGISMQNASEVDIVDLMKRLLTTMTGEGDSQSSSSPIRGGPSASSTMPPLPVAVGTGEDIAGVVDDLTMATNNFIHNLPADEQLESRRAMVLNLVDYTQNKAARTIAALLLLNYYLPQPNRMVERGTTNRNGCCAFAASFGTNGCRDPQLHGIRG